MKNKQHKVKTSPFLPTQTFCNCFVVKQLVSRIITCCLNYQSLLTFSELECVSEQEDKREFEYNVKIEPNYN